MQVFDTRMYACMYSFAHKQTDACSSETQSASALFINKLRIQP